MLVPIGLGHVPDAQHLVPVELRGGEPGVHLPRLGGFGGGPHPLDALFHGDGPAVGLVHAHESPDPQLLRRLLQLCDLGLLFFVLLHPLLVAAFLLHGVEAVIPAVKLRFPVLDLDDPGDGAVQEIPVVGDGDHRAVERANVLLQPLGSVEVQVVGGLVQQQDVRVLQDEAAQVHPGLLPAGEAVEKLLPLGVRNGQAVCDLVHRHVRVVAAEGLEPLAEGAVPLQNRRVALPGGHPGLQGPHLLRQALQPGESGAQHVLHRVAGGIDGDLGDQAHPSALAHHDGALVIVQLAGQYLEQGGLAGAVAAQQAHPLPLVHLKGEAVQDVLPHLKGFDQVVYLDLNHMLASIAPQASRSACCGTPSPA